MNKKLIFLFAVLIETCFVFSQRNADVVVPFSSDIETIVLNPYSGSVIVKDKDAIQSYNPESNSIEWKITKDNLPKISDVNKTLDVLTNAASGDFVKLMESQKAEVKFIPNSPFISFSIDNQDVILNSTNGKIIFSSAQLGMKLLQSEYLPSEKNFLLMAIDGKKYSCILYDLQEAKVKWNTELAPVESFMKSMGALFKSGPIPEDKVVTTPNSIFASINGDLYKLAKDNGKIEWKSDFRVTDFYLSRNGNNIIAIRSAGNLFSQKMALNLLDTKTGEKLWKDEITTKYITYIEDNSDKVLVAHANGFNFFSYADGKKLWKKDAKGNKIKQVIAIGDDYLYVADKEMNLIDKDGKNKWKNFIEICDNDEDEVFYLGKVDNNRVFYLTDTYGNMVDYTSGKKIWKKNIEFDKKKPLLYSHDKDKNVFLVYNDKKLFKFDPNATDKPERFAELKKVNDDKSMDGIELFDWGVSLVGQSDAIGVTFDGATKYHNTYKEPGGGSRKFTKTSASIGMGILGTASSINKSLAGAQVVVTTRDEFGNVTETSSDLFTKEAQDKMNARSDKADAISGLIDSNVMSKVKARFNALKHNSNYAFILDKAENGAQLVKVRKADGKEVDKIAIDNNKPIYEVDPVTDNVYYVHGKELKIYNQK